MHGPAIWLLLVVLLPACVPESAAGRGVTVRRTLQLAPEEVIASPDGYPHSVPVWDDDGQLLLFLRTDGWTVEYVYDDSSEVQQLILPEDPRCQRAKHYVERTLPDGRLGIRELCIGRWPERAPGNPSDEEYVLAYDWGLETIQQIVGGTTYDGSSMFTWNPEMTRGIQVVGSLLTTLFWISPEGIEPMEVTVRQGNQAWSLAETINIITNRDAEVVLYKRDVGNAAAPDWSPDGQIIAFMASIAAIDRQGIARGFSEYSLYLMDAVELEPYPVLDGVYLPSMLLWSPDGRWLAFNTQAEPRREGGLWLYSPEQKLLQLISEGDFRSLGWSPDGSKIAAIRCLKVICDQSEAVIFDLQPLLQ